MLNLTILLNINTDHLNSNYNHICCVCCVSCWTPFWTEQKLLSWRIISQASWEPCCMMADEDVTFVGYFFTLCVELNACSKIKLPSSLSVFGSVCLVIKKLCWDKVADGRPFIMSACVALISSLSCHLAADRTACCWCVTSLWSMSWDKTDPKFPQEAFFQQHECHYKPVSLVYTHSQLSCQQRRLHNRCHVWTVDSVNTIRSGHCVALPFHTCSTQLGIVHDRCFINLLVIPVNKQIHSLLDSVQLLAKENKLKLCHWHQ